MGLLVLVGDNQFEILKLFRCNSFLGVCTDQLYWLRYEPAGQGVGSVGCGKQPEILLRTDCGLVGPLVIPGVTSCLVKS